MSNEDFIISNNLRDAVTLFPKEAAAIITSVLPAFTQLAEESDQIDDELKTLLSEKKALIEEIEHYQQKIQAYAIERAQLNRIKPQELSPEVKENNRKKEALSFLDHL